MKLILLSLACLLYSNYSSGQHVVSGEFTSKTSFDDLIELRRELSAKNIKITYKHIEFNEDNQLKALSIDIETGGPDSTTFGSGRLMDFSLNGKISFKLEYGTDGDPSIEINVKQFGI